MDDAGYDAVVLAGGAARRLGGVDKPGLDVGGRRLLDRVLAAVQDARQRVVVGPPRDVPEGVRQVQEEPAGGGPAAAVGAALPCVEAPVVVLLAADLPFLDAATVQALRAALRAVPEPGGAVLVDDGDRPQWLAGAWRVSALRTAAGRPGATAPGARLRDLLAPLGPVPVRRPVGAAPAWYDCDTDDDLRRARSWA